MTKRINFDSLSYSPPALKNTCKFEKQEVPEIEVPPLPPLPNQSSSDLLYRSIQFEPTPKNNLISDLEQGLADFFADIEDSFSTIGKNIVRGHKVWDLHK